MFLLTGTPGVGKSTIADVLAERGYQVIRAKDTVHDYVLEESDDDTLIDVDSWADDFSPVDGIIEGHFSHFIPSANGVIILRCRPDILKSRLEARGYSEEKVHENVEAEALDVILIETLDLYTEAQIYEIDVSCASVEEIVTYVEHVVKGKAFPCCGIVDWTAWL